MPTVTHGDAEAALAHLRAEGFVGLAVELAEGAVPIEDFLPRRPVALVVGDEMLGVGADALAVCEAAVFVPMHGMGSSMSVVATMAIVAHQVAPERAAGVAQVS